MKISDRLENIRRDFPACETLAYADISTNTVLSSSAANPVRQEQLDHLCSAAVENFGGPMAELLSDSWQDAGAEFCDVYQIVTLNAAELKIFIRSISSPTDAFCCVCTPLIDVSAFVQGARHHLEQIGQDA